MSCAGQGDQIKSLTSTSVIILVKYTLMYEDRLKIDRSENRKVFSQVQLYVYKQEHYKYILPYLVVPSIHKKFEFLYS